MKKLLQILLLVSLSLIVISVNAQDPYYGSAMGKEILALAAKAEFDKDNIATAIWEGAKGKFTAAKLPKGQNANFKKGSYSGVLELQINGDFGKLKSGKFNLFFKFAGKRLNLYLEEKGEIANVLESSTKPPEGFKDVTDTKISDKPGLAFVEVSIDDGLSFNYQPKFTNAFLPSSNPFRKCKIYMKLSTIWVWSGFYGKCRRAAT